MHRHEHNGTPSMAASSAVLPDVAREHAWRLLWQRLLAPIPDDPETDEHDDEARTDEAA
jgi:hypothetical protein